MSRSPEGPDPDLLFDLPLDPDVGETTESAQDAVLDGDRDGDDQSELTFAPDEEPDTGPPPRVEAPLATRFVAAALDLVVLVAVLGFALLALRLLEVPIGRDVLAPLAVFLASFSFLYQVMPLAFWGHTPGMAYAGIHSRSKNGDFMTFQQCGLRWLGWVLTIATGGLAALLALSGVSLADVVSGSRSFVRD